jgi:antitoxin HicB
MKFNIVLQRAEEGGFTVTVPALDGCYTQGETLEEALENAKEAIFCYLEGLEKLNQIKSSPDAMVKEVEIVL